MTTILKALHILTDHLGSPILATDENGDTLWREDYQPYGTQLTNEDGDNSVGFTGHKDDKALGVTYMQGRWYHQEMGRFLAIDPVRFVEGNPITFNRYAYVNNNPYKYIDPDGELLVLAPAIPIAAESIVAGLLSLGLVLAIDESLDDGEDFPEDWEKDYEDWASANSDELTKHGSESASNSDREIGDPDEIRSNGERFRDTETGATVSVDGNEVVVDGVHGQVTQWNDQTEDETTVKVESGKWEPLD